MILFLWKKMKRKGSINKCLYRNVKIKAIIFIIYVMYELENCVLILIEKKAYKSINCERDVAYGK
jgi:hypothetical protein